MPQPCPERPSGTGLAGSRYPCLRGCSTPTARDASPTDSRFPVESHASRGSWRRMGFECGNGRRGEGGQRTPQLVELIRRHLLTAGQIGASALRGQRPDRHDGLRRVSCSPQPRAPLRGFQGETLDRFALRKILARDSDTPSGAQLSGCGKALSAIRGWAGIPAPRRGIRRRCRAARRRDGGRRRRMGGIQVVDGVDTVEPVLSVGPPLHLRDDRPVRVERFGVARAGRRSVRRGCGTSRCRRRRSPRRAPAGRSVPVRSSLSCSARAFAARSGR